MKLKRKHRKILLDALTIVTIIVAGIGVYFGLRFFLSTDTPLVAVASGSMRPALEVGDLVIVQGVPASEIKVGDIIVFNQPGETINTIHRVVAIETLANGTIEFRTKGDANPTADPQWTPEQNVKGRVLFRIPYLGYLALIPTIPITIIIIIIVIALAWPEKPKKFRHKPSTSALEV
jgi:signal peptidase